jgi:hypothetical protein
MIQAVTGFASDNCGKLVKHSITILGNSTGIQTRTAEAVQPQYSACHEFDNRRMKLPSPTKDKTYICNVQTGSEVHPVP